MVCGTIRCGGLSGPSGCVPSTHREALGGLHLVFHVSLLCRYEPSGDGVKPPPPIVVDEEEEYEVEALLAHRLCRGARQYLVRWRGYNNSEDSWLSETELANS